MSENKSIERNGDKKGFDNDNKVVKFTGLYAVLLIGYMALYSIFDSYNTSFYPMVVSFVIKDFGTNLSTYYFYLSIGSLGLYVVIFIQFLTDVIGRKPMLIIAFFGMGLSAFILSLSRTIVEYSFGLFILFIFFSSDIWVIYMSEEAPKERRARYSYIVMLIGVIGVLIIPFLRSYLVNPADPSTWRLMTYIAWLAMPLALFGLFFKETTLFTQQKLVKKELKKWNKNELFNKFKTPFSKGNRSKIMVFIITGFILGLNYNTFQTIEDFFMGNLNNNNDLVSMIILVGSLGSLIVFGFTGILADKIGRRPILTIYSITIFIGITGIVYFTIKDIVPGIFIFVVLAQIGYWGCFSLTKIYCAESFETKIRGGATGWRSLSYALGLTIGALFSSYLLGIAHITVGDIYILYGALALVFPLLVWKFLPETKGVAVI